MKNLKFKLAGLLQRHTKFLEEGWIMQDGTPWPGNKHQRPSRNDPGGHFCIHRYTRHAPIRIKMAKI